MSNLLPALAVLHWLHLSAAAALFGAAVFPLYAPTGRSLDRPLRLLVRLAVAVATATALAETGLAAPGLPRLALLVFACLIALSLRRNSWTVRIQARVLAAVACAALASIPFAAPPHVSPVLDAVVLIAVGAWFGALLPLSLVAARGGTQVTILAVRRVFVLAALAAVVVVAAHGIRSLAGGAAALPVSLRVLQAALLAALAGLALLDHFTLAPRIVERPAAAMLATSLRLQIVLAFATIGTIALAWVFRVSFPA